MVRPFTEGVARAAEMANEIVSTIVAAAVSVASGLNLVLSEVQRGVYLGTFIMTPEVVGAVIKANSHLEGAVMGEGSDAGPFPKGPSEHGPTGRGRWTS